MFFCRRKKGFVRCKPSRYCIICFKIAISYNYLLFVPRLSRQVGLPVSTDRVHRGPTFSFTFNMFQNRILSCDSGLHY